MFEEMLQVASSSFSHLPASVTFYFEWMSIATLVDVVARETIHSLKKILSQKQATYPLLAGVTS